MFFLPIDNLKNFFLSNDILEIIKSSSIFKLLILIPLFFINLLISLFEFSSLINILNQINFYFLFRFFLTFKTGKLSFIR